MEQVTYQDGKSDPDDGSFKYYAYCVYHTNFIVREQLEWFDVKINCREENMEEDVNYTENL